MPEDDCSAFKLFVFESVSRDGRMPTLACLQSKEYRAKVPPADYSSNSSSIFIQTHLRDTVVTKDFTKGENMTSFNNSTISD